MRARESGAVVSVIRMLRPQGSTSRAIAALYVLVWVAGLVLMVLKWNDLTWAWRVVASAALGITVPAFGDLRDIFLSRREGS